MLQRLPTALPQVKPGNTSKNILNEIRPMIYFLYHIALSNLSIHYTWKNIKKSYKNKKIKISSPTWNEELPDESYSVVYIQYYFKQIYKKHEKKADNLSIGIYVNKIESRITFRTKTGYYLELLIPEREKLFENTKSIITKDKYGKNVPHLEINEVLLVRCDIVKNIYQ